MAERVLVVEDEPDVLDALVQLLAHAGYEAFARELAAERDRLA